MSESNFCPKEIWLKRLRFRSLSFQNSISSCFTVRKVDKDANDYKAEKVTVLSEPLAQHFDAKYLTQQSLSCSRWEGFISEV